MGSAFVVWLLGGFLLVVALLVWRIPVPCRHATRCPVCRAEAAREHRDRRRRTVELGHRWHLEPARGCRMCFPDDDDLRG